MKLVYKNKMSLLVLAAVLVLSGCGRKRRNNGVAAGAPAPGPVVVTPTVTPTPGNTTWTNTNGGYFDWHFSQYQAAYGNISVPAPINLNYITIQAGTYTWSQFYSTYIVQGAQQCITQYGYSCGGNNGQWGNFNYGNFYNYYSGYWSNNTVVYVTGGSATGGGNMSVSISQLMNAFYGSIYNVYSSGYYGHYNTGYYYPNSYNPYCYGYSCYGSNYYGGNYYRSGSGWNLSIGIGGHF